MYTGAQERKGKTEERGHEGTQALQENSSFQFGPVKNNTATTATPCTLHSVYRHCSLYTFMLLSDRVNSGFVLGFHIRAGHVTIFSLRYKDDATTS